MPITQYRANFPIAINKAACHKLSLSHPAARHIASPSKGTQASSSTGEPKRRNFSTCLSFCVWGSTQPMPNETIPPRVFPKVPSKSAVQNDSGYHFSTLISAISDPPGSKVAARKLPIKNDNRLTDSAMLRKPVNSAGHPYPMKLKTGNQNLIAENTFFARLPVASSGLARIAFSCSAIIKYKPSIALRVI